VTLSGFGIGFLFADQFYAARWFFWLAAGSVVIRVWNYGWNNFPPRSRWIILPLFSILVWAIIFYLMIPWTHRLQSETEASKEHKDVHATTSAPIPGATGPQPVPQPSIPPLPLKLDFLINPEAIFTIVNDGREITDMEMFIADCALDHTTYKARAIKVDHCSFTDAPLKTIRSVRQGARTKIKLATFPFVKLEDIDRSTCFQSAPGTTLCNDVPNRGEHWYLVRFLFWDPVASETREHYEVVSSVLHAPIEFGHSELPGAQWKPGGHFWADDIPLLLIEQGREHYGTQYREYAGYSSDPRKLFDERQAEH
jgi:hypothetical protein